MNWAAAIGCFVTKLTLLGTINAPVIDIPLPNDGAGCAVVDVGGFPHHLMIQCPGVMGHSCLAVPVGEGDRLMPTLSCLPGRTVPSHSCPTIFSFPEDETE